ncbi:MAG: UDP-glucose 4-epimerase GalE [Ignavibacteriaceae bacterium]|nr:UDP-glucose 4-epimerase GalE [Ignavibacteriaceae bacterium]
MKILITGGAGYIGSHTVYFLSDKGYDITVLDNLSSGDVNNLPKSVRFVQGDVTDPNIASLFNGEKYDVLIHFAAKKDVGESMTNPGLYAKENIGGMMNLLYNVDSLGIKFIVFSSTAAVYGVPDKITVTEECETNPLNYYGFSKLEIERNLEWFSNLKGVRYAALRYFNAAGYDVQGRIKTKEKGVTNLLPVVMETLTGIREKLLVFGNDYDTPDGSCIRDYIHVNDLASAHFLAMQYLISEGKDLTVNLGTGKGHSVFEVINTVEKLSGKKLNCEITNRREGDAAVVIAGADKAYSLLGWHPEHSDLETIVKTMMPLYGISGPARVGGEE